MDFGTENYNGNQKKISSKDRNTDLIRRRKRRKKVDTSLLPEFNLWKEITNFLLLLWEWIVSFWTGDEYSVEREIATKWVRGYLPNVSHDFSESWKDGVILCSLMECLIPGSCAHPERLDKSNKYNNVKMALDTLGRHFGQSDVITADEIVTNSPNLEEKLILFLCELKERVTIYPKVVENQSPPVKEQPEVQACFAKGSGLSLGFVGRFAKVAIFCVNITELDIVIEIKSPSGLSYGERLTSRSPKYRHNPLKSPLKPMLSEIGRSLSHIEVSSQQNFQTNNDEIKNKELLVEYEILFDRVNFSYKPIETGLHKITILWKGKHLQGSPFFSNIQNVFQSFDDGNVKRLKPAIRRASVKPLFQNNQNQSRKTSIRFKEIDNSSNCLSKVIKRKILRYIVRLGDQDVAVEAENSEMLATALLKLDCRREGNAFCNRRNSWGFVGDIDRKKSIVRQFCVDLDENTFPEHNRRSSSFNNDYNNEIKTDFAFDLTSNSTQQRSLKTVREDMDKGFNNSVETVSSNESCPLNNDWSSGEILTEDKQKTNFPYMENSLETHKSHIRMDHYEKSNDCDTEISKNIHGIFTNTPDIVKTTQSSSMETDRTGLSTVELSTATESNACSNTTSNEISGIRYMEYPSKINNSCHSPFSLTKVTHYNRSILNNRQGANRFHPFKTDITANSIKTKLLNSRNSKISENDMILLEMHDPEITKNKDSFTNDSQLLLENSTKCSLDRRYQSNVLEKGTSNNRKTVYESNSSKPHVKKKVGNKCRSKIRKNIWKWKYRHFDYRATNNGKPRAPNKILRPTHNVKREAFHVIHPFTENQNPESTASRKQNIFASRKINSCTQPHLHPTINKNTSIVEQDPCKDIKKIVRKDTVTPIRQLYSPSSKSSFTLQTLKDSDITDSQLSLQKSVKDIIKDLEELTVDANRKQLVKQNFYSLSLNFPPLAANDDRARVSSRIRQWETTSSLPCTPFKNKDLKRQLPEVEKLSGTTHVQSKTLFFENIRNKPFSSLQVSRNRNYSASEDSNFSTMMQRKRLRKFNLAKHFDQYHRTRSFTVVPRLFDDEASASVNEEKVSHINSEVINERQPRRRHSYPISGSQSNFHTTYGSGLKIKDTNSLITFDTASSSLALSMNQNDESGDEYIDDEIPDYAAMFLNEYAPEKGMYFELNESCFGPKAEECIAFGGALYYGYVAEKNHFQVLTKGAGKGTLSVSLQGSSVHDVTNVSVTYRRKDIYDITYQVMEPGYYLISVKWSDISVPGSPFICKVTY